LWICRKDEEPFLEIKIYGDIYQESRRTAFTSGPAALVLCAVRDRTRTTIKIKN
jgi:hypothetical protein